MEVNDRRTEIAELRQWIDWLSWRVGELERNEAAAQPPPTAYPVAPQPIAPQPAAAQPVAAQPLAAQPVAAQPVATAPVATQPHWPHHHPAAGAPPRAPRKPLTLEDLLSPERLAWAGGAMLIAGIAFLVSWGIHNGWITPTMRIVGAAVACLALAGGGLLLRRRGDEGVVPHAMAAVSIAGLFATFVAASVRYDMFDPIPVGLALAAVITGIGVQLSSAWNSQLLGGLALSGSILAPSMIDAPTGFESVAFALVAFVAAMVLCAIRGWQWTGTVAIFLAVLVIPARASEIDSLAAQLAIWSVAWAGTQIGAFARVENETGKVVYAIALFISTAAFAGIGADVIEDVDVDVAHGWVAALAVAHTALALAGARLRRIAEFDWIIAAVLATIAAALIISGVALVATWCALAAAIAWQTHDSRPERARILARVGAGLLLALATMKVIDKTEADTLLQESFSTLTANEMLALTGALGSIFAASLLWMWRERPSRALDGEAHVASDAASTPSAAAASTPSATAAPATPGAELIPLAAAIWAPAWLVTVLLDGPAVVCAIVALAFVWQTAGRRTFGGSGAIASVVLLTAAALHTLIHEAPPYEMLIAGIDDLTGAAIVLVALAIGCAAHALGTARGEKTAAYSLAALALVYLGSGTIIWAFPPDFIEGFHNDTLVEGSGQTGQALLSAFWALIAFVAVIIGLRLRIKEIRIVGLSLLIVAVLKILLFDLANLEAAYRTISFIVTGAVLLAAAFAFQRLSRDDDV